MAHHEPHQSIDAGWRIETLNGTHIKRSNFRLSAEPLERSRSVERGIGHIAAIKSKSPCFCDAVINHLCQPCFNFAVYAARGKDDHRRIDVGVDDA
jgi:hypothetical protein